MSQDVALRLQLVSAGSAEPLYAATGSPANPEVPLLECLCKLPLAVIMSVAASGAGSFTAQPSQQTRHYLVWHLQAELDGSSSTVTVMASVIFLRTL